MKTKQEIRISIISLSAKENEILMKICDEELDYNDKHLLYYQLSRIALKISTLQHVLNEEEKPSAAKAMNDNEIKAKCRFLVQKN